jgi:hypothetical protein
MTRGKAHTYLWFYVYREVDKTYCSFLGYGVMNNVPEERISLSKSTPIMEVVLAFETLIIRSPVRQPQYEVTYLRIQIRSENPLTNLTLKIPNNMTAYTT